MVISINQERNHPDHTIISGKKYETTDDTINSGVQLEFQL